MNTFQYCWKPVIGWEKEPQPEDCSTVDLLLVFGATSIVTEGSCIAQLAEAFPDAIMTGCTTGGEKLETTAADGWLAATAVSFFSSRVHGASVMIGDYCSSEEATRALVAKIPLQGLRHLFILADGVLTNGSEVVRGLNCALPESIPVTGGLAGDGMSFRSACTIFNGEVKRSAIAVIGFYGDRLKIGYGSCGGWIPFGPQRLITSSAGNTMYELDGRSVLDLYRPYLGPDSEKLPASGLLFPLSVAADDEDAVVRTIMAVDERSQSLSFAGDVPTGSYARLMHAVPDDLIDGAAEAAMIAGKACGRRPGLCILISCIGRREVLRQLTEEEIELTAEYFMGYPAVTGFYSYGEIAPFYKGGRVILHNQTMTITALTEEDDAQAA